MNQTLGLLRWDICLAYLDDIIVYSPSFDQHLLDVNQVCQVLHASNFKLNYNKCAFFQREISFLGHKINADGCSPNNDNIRSITQFPLLQSSKAAPFLQMVGCYRKFIPRFSQISASLNRFTWKAIEKKYSAIELEALAIWWSVTQRFRSYIEGQQFFLETDHKPLISLMKKPYHNARIEQWMTTLQQYNMIIQHIPGRDSTTADALSRYPVDQPDVNDEDAPRLVTSSTQTEDLSTTTTPRISRSTPPVVSSSSSLNDINISFDHDTLNLHQNQDSAIQAIKNVSPLNSKYTLDDYNILYKIITRKNGHVLQLPYVPASLTSQVLLMHHNSTFSGGHFGIKRTFYKIHNHFFWPDMYKDIERHILSCINCRKNKPSRRKSDGHLHPIEPSRGVWEYLTMDYVGPVTQSKSGNKYFPVLTDLFSKLVITKAVPDNTSTTAAKFLLYDVFMIYGVPFEIVTDNGTHFSPSLYEFLLKLTQCCHVKTTPYNPKANDQCERHNATLVPNLVALSNQSRSNWVDKLVATTFNYNATRRDSTGYTPFELIFARQPRFVADLSSSFPSSSHTICHYHHTM
ncbi:unnamed protein product [Rotaria sp. Silwood1]|nr:unnamed protein product [Rotaria sp. Silwood1]CAF4592780.1 unnamed protein product [Rotaria sp. Silwood1]CAF4839780.1 unnamed protein product [Rotaria sp. Silwood1]CAF4857453.1 unnamed protein product [Rotaria sp. Silwood1]